MKFKSNSIVLTDEIDVFMNVFDELLKLALLILCLKQMLDLQFISILILKLKLPSGAIDVANKGHLIHSHLMVI